jgi:hypothetical protein
MRWSWECSRSFLLIVSNFLLCCCFSCFNYNRATLLAFLRHFGCVCESVCGVLERPHQIGNGHSWERWSVQTLGACTKPSQHLFLLTTHTQGQTQRDRHRESFPAHLCKNQAPAENWIILCCAPSSTGFTDIRGFAQGFWFCCLNLDFFLLLVDDFNTVEELAYAGNMADKAIWISVAIWRFGSAGVLPSRWQHDCVCCRSYHGYVIDCLLLCPLLQAIVLLYHRTTISCYFFSDFSLLTVESFF